MWEADLLLENDSDYMPDGKSHGELVTMMKGKVSARTTQKRIKELLESGKWIKGWKYIIDTMYYP